MNLDEILRRIGKSDAEVKVELEEIRQEEARLHPEMTADQISARALRRLLIRYKRELASPSVWFDGVVVGDSGVFDAVARRRALAIAEFTKNPTRAVELGLTDVKGVPLDNRPTIGNRPNPNFLKPLPESAPLRVIWGAAKQAEGTKLMFFRMIMGIVGDKYKLNPPMFTPVRFRANVSPSNVPGSDMLLLNSATVTEFKPSSSIKLSEALDVIRPKVPLSQLEIWHRQRAQVPPMQRVLLTEGDVVDIRPIRGGISAKVMFLWDDGVTVEPGIPVFIPDHLAVDFGPESRVIVFGRTGTRRVGPPEQRIEAGVNISALGIYPVLRVPPKEEITATPPIEAEIEEEELW